MHRGEGEGGNTSFLRVYCLYVPRVLARVEVRYLGRVVSGDGHSLDPEDTAAEHNLAKQKPATEGDVRKLLGFLSYYRQYIQDFSRIAKPLYDLMAGPDPLASNHRVTCTNRGASEEA